MPSVGSDDNEAEPHIVDTDVTSTENEQPLDRLPLEQRRAIIRVVEAQLSHSGPLPPPEQLRDYNEVLPGLAERIVRLTEEEQEHRHKMVSLTVRRDARLRERGQVLGLVALVLTLLFCAYLVWTGNPNIAGVVAVGLVIGAVSIFVTGRHADLKAAERDLDQS